MRERPDWVAADAPAPGSPPLRALFPLLAEPIHGRVLAYLDNAATTPMPTPVLDAMRAFEHHSRANIHRAVHTLSERATEAHDGARRTLRQFVGAGGGAHELIFTSGTTEALNLVALGLALPGEHRAWLREGDEIIVSGLEHHANVLPWQRTAQLAGARLRWLMPDAQGRLQLEQLAELIGPHTRVLALTACANATGERPPYEAMLRLAKAAGALTVLDAAQAVSHSALDVAQLDADFVAFSGHKMYGPMGIGALVGRLDALERLAPLRLGGDMVDRVGPESATFAPLPMRLEGGTPHVAGAVGMAAAAEFVQRVGLGLIDAHVCGLRAQAAAALGGLPGVHVLAPHAEHAAIVAFTAEGVHAHDIGTLLDARGVAVRTGQHCAQPLAAHLGIAATTRASFAMFNTAAEVGRLVAGVAEALEQLK